MQNEEPREVDGSFAEQADAQRGGLPTAPSTPAIVPANPPAAPLRTPQLETLAERAGQRVNWRATKIG